MLNSKQHIQEKTVHGIPFILKTLETTKKRPPNYVLNNYFMMNSSHPFKPAASSPNVGNRGYVDVASFKAKLLG
jgi:hypothetical protein